MAHAGEKAPETLSLYYNINLWGYCTHNQKFACFVLDLKIINIFLKNDLRIIKQIVQGTQN